MSETAPEPAGGGGNFLTRSPLAGVPNWLWLVLGTSVAAGGYILLRGRRNKKAAAQQQATATQVQAACTDANNNPVPCNSLLAVNSEGQSEYEQLTSQLTGLSGQEAALGATVQQLQGQVSQIPAGPPGPAGGPGPTGSTGPSGPTPAPSAAVPKVTGMTFAQAKAALANAGFTAGGGAVSKNYAPGTIITSQTPAPGTHIAYGTAYWPVGGSPHVSLG